MTPLPPVQAAHLHVHFLLLIGCSCQLHLRREIILLHQVRLYTSQQRNLAGMLHNIGRKLLKSLHRRSLERRRSVWSESVVRSGSAGGRNLE